MRLMGGGHDALEKWWWEDMEMVMGVAGECLHDNLRIQREAMNG